MSKQNSKTFCAICEKESTPFRVCGKCLDKIFDKHKKPITNIVVKK